MNKIPIPVVFLMRLYRLRAAKPLRPWPNWARTLQFKANKIVNLEII